MTRRRTISVLVLAVAAMMAAFIRVHSATADDDDEKPIISNAAKVSRDAAGDVVIAIRPAAQKEIGLSVVTLKRAVRSVEVEAYGVVLDPAPLSKLSGELSVAQAALDVSREQFQRSRHLYAEQKNVSLRKLQIARAAYLTDKARFDALERQLRDSWGGEIAKMNLRMRSGLVSALIDRREVVARVTVPAGEPLDGIPRRARMVALGHRDSPLPTQAIYYAPTIDPRMQGQSFLLLVRAGKFPIRPGMAVFAALPASGKAETGVIVPRPAVVRYNGGEWVYEERKDGRFMRLQIRAAQLLRHGYFVTQGPAAGTRIVVAGAQTLLSEELKSHIHLED